MADIADHASVSSRADLVDFIDALRNEMAASPSAWKNADLSEFLAGLSGWIADSPGSWSNLGRPEPAQPDWVWVALSLRSATAYE